MSYELHLDRVFNVQLSQTDAAFISKALIRFRNLARIGDLTPKGGTAPAPYTHEDLDRMTFLSEQLNELSCWKEPDQ
tara:strand:+ start:300 stop:530 length:231 start_codon:yes stop_codon:yes gene_type:complete